MSAAGVLLAVFIASGVALLWVINKLWGNNSETR
jgi:uncharacterized iron-regulated membrane protein